MFHRIDDMWEMDAARFFQMARRLPAYGGAVAAALNSQQEGTREPMARSVTRQPGAQGRPDVRTVGASAAELKTSDIGDLFTIGRSGG